MTLLIGENPPIAASKVLRDTPRALARLHTPSTKLLTEACAGEISIDPAKAAAPSVNDRREMENGAGFVARNMRSLGTELAPKTRTSHAPEKITALSGNSADRN